MTVHDGKVAPLTLQNPARAIFFLLSVQPAGTVFPFELRRLIFTMGFFGKTFQIRAMILEHSFPLRRHLVLIAANLSLLCCQQFEQKNARVERPTSTIITYSHTGGNQKTLSVSQEILLVRLLPRKEVRPC